MNLKATFDLLKDTYAEWNKDKAPQMGAALAYYTIFALAPLLVILIAMAGLVLGEEAARGQIVGQIQGLVGQEAARVIETTIESAGRSGAGIIGTIVGTGALLLGAAGLFSQLKAALNTIWDAQPEPTSGIVAAARQRVMSLIVSFAMVLVTGALILTLFVATAALAAFGGLLNTVVPGIGILLRLANFLLSFGIVTMLFAAIFKILPDKEIPWRDVWIGAAFTSLLFTIGKELIGIYIGRAGVGSAFGAAGALIALLVWLYYSAQILFFGAEFTQVYSRRYGEGQERGKGHS